VLVVGVATVRDRLKELFLLSWPGSSGATSSCRLVTRRWRRRSVAG